ncbi:MAG: hypothetical protein ACE5JN_15310 [Candidatus Methylomirabilia bacterium]
MKRLLAGLLSGLMLLPARTLVASHTDYLFDPRQFRHHVEDGYFDLYWNYTHPAPDLLTARGYVRAQAQSPDVEVVTLELLGVDEAERRVSGAFGFTRGGKIFPWESSAFFHPSAPDGARDVLPPPHLAP